LDVSVLPLSLPANCPSGPNYLYVSNGGISGGPSSGSPDYQPNGNPNGPGITAVSQNDPDQPTSATVSLTGLKEDPRTAGNGVVLDFHLLQDDGSTLRQPLPAPNGITGTVVLGSVTLVSPNDWQATVTVPVPAAVRTTPGAWRVRALQAGGTNKWTPDSAVGTLTVGVASSPGCPVPSTGDFGLLDSPRSDGGSSQQQRFRNFALGLDHGLVAVAAPTTDLACSADRSPYPDGILDDNVPARGDESCIDVKPGESASLPTDGLVDGRGGESGRLEGSPPVSAGSPAGSACTVAGDSDLQWTSRSGKDLVDTVLSCYLARDRTLADVAAGRPDSLTADIVEDPRFFFVPVTATSVRPPNSGAGDKFWPIKTFRGAFLTNESVAGDATCLGSSDCNGLLFNNGGQQLKAVQAFTFPLSALPSTVDQPGNGGDYYGGTKDFLLVK
jgi:hypothetical protein